MRKRIIRTLLTLCCFIAATLMLVGALAVKRYEILQLGDKDEYVLKLQKELHARGYLSAAPTGYFGTETQKAVIRWQERHDLTPDGKAGPKTQQSIMGKYYVPIPSTRVVEDTAPAESPGGGDSDFSSLRVGDEGPTVKKVQERLKELGYYSYKKITAYYGDITAQAVVDFQKNNGLKDDGVVGKKTYNALFAKNARKKAAGSSSEPSTSSDGVKQVKQSSEGKTKAEQAIDKAKSLIGSRYRTGGTGPTTFDCSGFVYYILKGMGVKTPRSSSEMGAKESWPKVAKKDLKPGDLVFFTSPRSKGGIGHVGMYIGDGKFIHSSSGSAKGVIISSLSSTEYTNRYKWARRVFS